MVKSLPEESYTLLMHMPFPIVWEYTELVYNNSVL